MRLEDKVAIVTGAAHGMGEAEARLFAQEGAKFVVAEVLGEQAEAVAADIRAGGGEAIAATIDVTSEPAWVALIEKTVARYGRLDILVNNAGISGSSVGDPDGREGWHRIIAVNQTASFSAPSSPPRRWRRPAAVRSSTSARSWALSAAPAAIPPIAPRKALCGSIRNRRRYAMAPWAFGSIRCIPAICRQC